MCRARGIGRQARGNATAPSPIAAAAIGARPRSAPRGPRISDAGRLAAARSAFAMHQERRKRNADRHGTHPYDADSRAARGIRERIEHKARPDVRRAERPISQDVAQTPIGAAGAISPSTAHSIFLEIGLALAGRPIQVRRNRAPFTHGTPRRRPARGPTARTASPAPV